MSESKPPKPPPRRPAPARNRATLLIATAFASGAVLLYVLYLFVSKLLAGYATLLVLLALVSLGVAPGPDSAGG